MRTRSYYSEPVVILLVKNGKKYDDSALMNFSCNLSLSTYVLVVICYLHQICAWSVIKEDTDNSLPCLNIWGIYIVGLMAIFKQKWAACSWLYLIKFSRSVGINQIKNSTNVSQNQSQSFWVNSSNIKYKTLVCRQSAALTPIHCSVVLR